MTINFSEAVSAYNRAVKQQGLEGIDARDQVSGSAFADTLRDVAESTIDSLSKGETETLKAAAGQADITEVVMAMSQAEITLQTVVALRDRVIQAYQEIMRMPI
jgi:flagellar hook-basal body complex protein FliE